MNRPRSICLALAGICLVGLAASVAQQVPAAQRPATGTYSAKLITVGEPQSAMLDLLVKTYYFASQEELQRDEEILGHKKEGQQELMEALHRHQDMGQFRVGTGGAYALNLITWEETRKGYHVFMAGNRFSMRSRGGRGQDPRDFPFMAIALDIDANGNGQGTFYDGAKLRFNKKHRLEVADYFGEPATVVKVRLDVQ